MFDKLSLSQDRVGVKLLLVLIAVAYLFSFGMRMIWVAQFSETPEYHWNSHLMINTNDGYYWAEGARDLVSGHHELNDRSPIDRSLPIITALIAKALPFIPFDNLILYMPAVFGSLVVIPLILIGRQIGATWLGFLAAVIGSITHSFYNRTMTGYFDDDMFAIVVPVFMVWALIAAWKNKNETWLGVVAAVSLFSTWYYGNLLTIYATVWAALLGYTLVFERKEAANYKLLLVFMLTLIPTSFEYGFIVTISLIIAFLTVSKLKPEIADKYSIYVLGLAVIAYVGLGGIGGIAGKLQSYVFRSGGEQLSSASAMHFFSVTQTVREAGKIPFEVVAQRLSGNTFVLIFALIGYLLMAVRYRILLIAVPLVGMGLMAYKSGLRFTVYGVPFMALGFAYLAYFIAQKIQNLVLRVQFFVLAACVALYPNIQHIIEYRVPTVLSAQEVSALDKLKKMSGREDYVYTWWDYGYPVRYYADVKNHSDGGKHDGGSNFVESSVLTADNTVLAANLLRETTERWEQMANDPKNRLTSTLEYMMAHSAYGNVTEPTKMLELLRQEDFKLPKKTRDVFLMLPFRMMEIYPTVRLFSNLDLKTGQPIDQSFFYFSQNFQETGAAINLGNGIALNKQNATVNIGQQQVPLKAFYRTAYDNTGKLGVQMQPLNPAAPLHLIFLQSYKAFILCDERMFNSLYIQMFVFDRFDPRYFEPAVMDPLMKIYKLKV